LRTCKNLIYLPIHLLAASSLAEADLYKVHDGNLPVCQCWEMFTSLKWSKQVYYVSVWALVGKVQSAETW